MAWIGQSPGRCEPPAPAWGKARDSGRDENGKVSKPAIPMEESLPLASQGSSWVSYTMLSSGGGG